MTEKDKLQARLDDAEEVIRRMTQQVAPLLNEHLNRLRADRAKTDLIVRAEFAVHYARAISRRFGLPVQPEPDLAQIVEEHAGWLLDAISMMTQNPAYLRKEPEEDTVATEAIIECGKKAIVMAISAYEAKAV